MGFGVWAAAAIAAATLGVGAAGAATVHTDKGDVYGVTAGAVETFKGIPFAAPPVGDLRWRPPQPAARWTGLRSGADFGPECVQPQRPGMAAIPMSEDCLTLNVWRPADAKPGQRLPVMVWIYGGAFIFGAGSAPIYDGTHFAEDGVVLVTFNYRVGRFGFFAHPALDGGDGPVGNYAFMDQIAALQWVKRNIAAFGGDPRNVTVFGESAGAISVNYLMGSPAARGLFAKAIAESGFGRSEPRPLRGDGSAEGLGTAFAAANHVIGDDAGAAAALRALPADALNASPGGVGVAGSPTPILDGKIVVESIAEAFARNHAALVPYLEGGNSYEASLFPHVGDNPDPVIARAGDPAKVIALYGGGDHAAIARELTTDTMITEPNRLLAQDEALQLRTAYLYHFSYVPAAARAASFGAAHGAEVTYVFDNLYDHPMTFGARTIPAATPDDRKIAAAMHAYWVHFAKTGAPGAAGGPLWPAYNPATDRLVEFGADGVNIRAHFDASRLDFLSLAADRSAAH